MLNALTRGTISPRGRWTESLEVVSPDGAIDPALYVMKVRIWLAHLSPHMSCSDWWWNPYPYGLSADTSDPLRLVFQASDRGGILTWDFPASETERLEPGSYVGSVTSQLIADPTEIEELATFRRVVIA